MPLCSLDDLTDYFGIERPNAIKIDVDGIEHLILKGGEVENQS
jgi:FkbM family methyltransferase